MKKENAQNPLKNEVWKRIEDFQHYEVSSMGRVRKIKKFNKHDTAPLKTPLTGYDRKGYHAFQLTLPGSNRKYVSGHVLVLEAFVSKRPPGHIAHHKDTNTKNNCLLNLKWTTPSNNIKYAYIAGNLNQVGSKNNGSILVESQVLKIKKLLKTTQLKHNEIGNMFGVARSTISQISAGLNWGYLEA